MSIIDTAPLPPRTQKKTLGEFSFDGTITALFEQGFDTVDISRMLGPKDFPEFKVANRLAKLREYRRP